MSKIFNGEFKKLDNPIRKELIPPEKIINLINLKTDDEVIDFGCGVGFFTLPAAKHANQGLIYAVDLSSTMLDELEIRANKNKIENVELIESKKIPATILVDKIISINVVHELDNLKSFFIDCKNALKKNGTIIIIDFQKKTTNFGPPIEHRIAKEVLLELLNELDLKILEKQIHEDFYFLIASQKQI